MAISQFENFANQSQSPLGFAAGTLVHTQDGLKPIEQIKVGDWVLSKHENGGGEQAYKRVSRTIKSESMTPVNYLKYYSEPFDQVRGLFVTSDHPFFAKNVGWKPAVDVTAPRELVSCGDISIHAYEFYTLWCTPEEGVAVGLGHINDTGPVIDLRNDERAIIREDGDETDQGGKTLLWCETVFNLEVEDFHTYYVGDLGIWVHNSGCAGVAAGTCATARARDAAAREEGHSSCFAAGTLVHTKDGLKPIEEIKVGDWVLSFPDDQAPPDKVREECEYFYKKVTQVFVTEDRPLCRLIVSNLVSGTREEFMVTPEHPIYCKGRGWVPVSEIDACDCVENFLFGNLMVSRCYQNVARGRVYNFELEDFHTYYVGSNGVWVHNTCRPDISQFELSKRDTWKLADRAEIVDDH